MPRRKIGDRLEDWAMGVLEGKTTSPVTADLQPDFQEAKYTGPPVRTRRAVQRFLANYDPVRWRRMQDDMAYFKAVMKKLDLNPEDVRFLL